MDRVRNGKIARAFISGLLQKASEYDDPGEQAAAFLKSQEAIGREFGVNTAALPVIQSPAAIQRTQKGINDAFTAMQKQYKEEMFAPGWGKGVWIDVNGHQMSGADVLRRQTVLARDQAAMNYPPPDTGTGQEGINLATAYRAFKDDPKRGNGRWPNAAEQNKIQLQPEPRDCARAESHGQCDPRRIDPRRQDGGDLGEDGPRYYRDSRSRRISRMGE